MAQTTEIEWTHMPGYTGVTWNPTRGCSRVSEGCRNCYAETIAKRFSGDAAESVDRTAPFWSFATHRGWTGKVELIESKLAEPLSNRKPWKDPCCVDPARAGDPPGRRAAELERIRGAGEGGWVCEPARHGVLVGKAPRREDV